MTEWISTKDRLPAKGQYVVLLNQEGYSTTYFFYPFPNLNEEGKWMHCDSEVLYWFPVPDYSDLPVRQDYWERD